jgi:uncharacterized membrane protein/protein-disulfide isomerase
MTPRQRQLILGFALLGLLFSGWSALVHYRLLTQPNYISPCDVNATFSCSDAYLSRFGSVGGVSVAVPGVIFFVVVGLLAAFGGSRRPGRADATGSYVFALSTAGLAAVLYLAWASWFVLNSWCPLCIGTYVAVIGLFIVSGMTSSVPMSGLPARLMEDVGGLTRRPASLVAALAVIAVAVVLLSWFPHDSTGVAPTGATPEGMAGAGAAVATGSTGEQASFEQIWAAQPRIELGVPAEGAQVIVAKFIDWQCPSCRAAHLAYEPILAKYQETHPGAVRAVTKDYPLSNKCNFNMTGPGHVAACEAAASVRLAAERGQEKEMVDWLFANQATLTPQSVEAEVNRRLGITDFSAQYARVLPAIRSDIADGSALQVQYTPTYFINGVKAQTPDGGWLAPQYVDWAIQYEMKRAGDQ